MSDIEPHIDKYFIENENDTGTYQFKVSQKLFLNDDQQYALSSVCMQHEKWPKTSQIIFSDCTILWKRINTKYTLTIKCKNLPVIPELVRNDGRCHSVIELRLSNNELTEIPNGIEVFDSLKTCKLDRNHIQTLKPYFGKLNTLESVDLSNNNLNTIPNELLELSELKSVHLSSNSIMCIPDGISKLTKLESLLMSSNKLKTLPGEFGKCLNLKYLKLTCNRFFEFPAPVLALNNLEELNISVNKIRTVPLELFDKSSLSIFHAGGNPLQQPPIGIVNSGLSAIREYCRALKEGDVRDNRLKVMFLGKSEAGKTTLCKAIEEGKSIGESERTVGIEKYTVDLRDFKFVFWDFAGQLEYYQTHHIFITHDALVVLVVNLAEYKLVDEHSESESYKELVHLWIANVSMRVPNAVVLVVGTHIDVVREQGEDPEAKMEDIMKRIKCQQAEDKINLEARIQKLKEDLSNVNNKDLELKTLRKKIEILERQLEEELQIQLNYHMLCSQEPKTEGLPQFKTALMKLAENEDLFPEQGKNRPKSWVAVEQLLLEERKNASGGSQTGMRKLEDTVSLILSRNIDDMNSEDRIHHVLKYLHNLGEIIWFDDVTDLKNYIFINPPMLISVFKKVICHEPEKNLKKMNRDRKKVNLTQTKYNEYMRKFQERALVNHKLLQMLWMDLLENESQVETLVGVLEQFRLCYTIDVRDEAKTPTKPVLEQHSTSGGPGSKLYTRPETPDRQPLSNSPGNMASQSFDSGCSSPEFLSPETDDSSARALGQPQFSPGETPGKASIAPDMDELTHGSGESPLTPRTSKAVGSSQQESENRSLNISTQRRHNMEKKFSLFPCYLKSRDGIRQEIWNTTDNFDEITIKFEIFPMKPRGFFERLSVCCHSEEFRSTTLRHRHIKILDENSVEALIYIDNENDEIMMMCVRKTSPNQHFADMWNLILNIYGCMLMILELWSGTRLEMFSLCPTCLTDKGPENASVFEIQLPSSLPLHYSYRRNMSGMMQCEGEDRCNKKIKYDLVQPVASDEKNNKGKIIVNSPSMKNYHFNIKYSSVQVGNYNEITT